MEFTNFYNIKTEQTVSPFMHLAARAGIPGLVQAGTTQTKEEKVDRQQDQPTVHIVQVPALHHQQTHHIQSNDTAFPGAAPIRHNVQQRQPQQAHILQPTQYTIKQQPGTEQIHIKTAYTTIQQKEKPPKERLYKCGDCDKAFMREEHLKRHTLVHTGHPMHSLHRCEVPGCNKTYTRKDLLTNHLKYIHLGVQPDRPFLCIDCGKDFVRRDHLQRHRKNVHGTGPMAAAVAANAAIAQAQQTAAVQQQQQQQQQQHTVAAAAAAVQQSAAPTVQHVTIAQERPKRRFLCVTCGKDFNRKDHLQRHQKNVHHQGQPGNPAATVSVPVEVAPSSRTVTLAQHQTSMSIAN